MTLSLKEVESIWGLLDDRAQTEKTRLLFQRCNPEGHYPQESDAWKVEAWKHGATRPIRRTVPGLVGDEYPEPAVASYREGWTGRRAGSAFQCSSPRTAACRLRWIARLLPIESTRTEWLS